MKNKTTFIVAVGIDIEEVGRFRKLMFRKNKNFYEKIFTQAEIEYCLKKKDPYPYFTARFCAKEAFIKACPEKIASLSYIEIIKSNKKPKIKTQLVKDKIHLSLSHTSNYASAVVVIEKTRQ